MPGTNISPVETSQITSIERDGFWLLTESGEYFVSFEEYPDFWGATLGQIFDFKGSDGDLHWPGLDVDIELDALKNPERFPLRFKR